MSVTFARQGIWSACWRSLCLCRWSVRWELLEDLYCRPEVKSRVMCLWLVLRSLHSGNPIRVTHWEPLKNKFQNKCDFTSSSWPERTLRTVNVGQRLHFSASGQLEHTPLWHSGNELGSEKKVRGRMSQTVSQRVLNERPVLEGWQYFRWHWHGF